MNSSEPWDDAANGFDALMAACHEVVIDEGGAAAVASLPLGLNVEWVGPLQEITDCLARLERLRRGGDTPAWETTLLANGPKESAGAPDVDRERLNGEGAPFPRRIGRFEIERELGCGGHGIVYLGRDPDLDRAVAVKVPRPEMLFSREMRARFLREGRATARLSHPNLLSVFESGEAGPLCYLASAFCAGPTLAEWLRDQTQDVEPRLAAEITRQLADGLDYAHSRGVLHRDVKPGNVFLDPAASGTVMARLDKKFAAVTACAPRLGDFGLARITDDSVDQATGAGAILGTPSYMAPEQASGKTGEVGVASDIYSLGAILYELLTRKPPFRGASNAATLKQVLFDEPPPPRRIQPSISRDLEAICLRCLRKEPAGRYPSARELADDLDRYLRGEPTRARPLPLYQQVASWSKRYPSAAALTAVLIIGAISIVAGTTWFSLRLSAALAAAQAHERLAEARSRESREYEYAANVRLAQEAWDHSSPNEARKLLDRYIPGPGEPDLRGPEWHYLNGLMSDLSTVVARQESPVWSLALRPDERQFATGDKEGVIRIWNLDPPGLIREFRAHAGNIDAMLYTPDGKTLISGADDHHIRFWSATSGDRLTELTDHDAWIGAMALTPDGRQLVSGDGDGQVTIRDLSDPHHPRRLYKHRGYVRWIAIHPIQPCLVSAADNEDLRLWNYLENKPPRERPSGTLVTPPNSVWRQGVFCKGGNVLWASERNSLLKWTFGSLEEWNSEPARYESPDKIMSVATINEGDVVLEGGEAAPDVRSRQFARPKRVTHSLKGHSSNIRWIIPLRGADEFLSASDDGTVRRWNLNPDRPGRIAARFPQTPNVVSWHPSGEVVYVGCKNGYFASLGIDGRIRHEFLLEQAGKVDKYSTVTHVARDGTGHRVLIVMRSGKLFLSSAKLVSQSSIQTLPYQLPRDAAAPLIVKSGRRLCFVDHDFVVAVDIETGAEQWRHVHPRGVWDVEAISEDEIATADGDGIVRRIDVGTGVIRRRSVEMAAGIYCLDLSSDSRRLVAGIYGKKVAIFDAVSLEVKATFSVPIESKNVSFFDDDRRLMAWDVNDLIFVDTTTGQTLLKQSLEFGMPAAISPDGGAFAIHHEDWINLVRLTPPPKS